MPEELNLDALLGDRFGERATFHDAFLESIDASYVDQRASLVFKIRTEDEDSDPRYSAGVLSFAGLQFLVIEPPAEPFSDARSTGAWITADGPFPDPKVRSAFKVPSRLAETSFVHYFFASDWNAFIFIGATTASFAWND